MKKPKVCLANTTMASSATLTTTNRYSYITVNTLCDSHTHWETMVNVRRMQTDTVCVNVYQVQIIIRVHRNWRVQCVEVFVSLRIDGRKHLHLKCGIGAGMQNYNHIMTGPAWTDDMYKPPYQHCLGGPVLTF